MLRPVMESFWLASWIDMQWLWKWISSKTSWDNQRQMTTKEGDNQSVIDFVIMSSDLVKHVDYEHIDKKGTCSNQIV